MTDEQIMKIIKYDKLIRDNIPKIIKEKGIESVTRIAEAEEYKQKLKEKLEEEVSEFLSSDESHEVDEIADILEVLYAICAARGIGKKQIEEIRTRKAKERGGLEKRIILEETGEK